MPYHVMLRTPELLQITLRGHLQNNVAQAFFEDVWQMLDDGPSPLHLLVDGRGIQSASQTARSQFERIGQHPHLGHIAFVVGQPHVLLFAPVVRFIGGVGLFSSEQEALKCLQAVQNFPMAHKQDRPDLFERAVGDVLEQCAVFSEDSADVSGNHEDGLAAATILPGQPSSARRAFRLLTDMIDNLSQDIDTMQRSFDHVRS
ncbi:MAG: hypothetical protein ACLFVO_25200 [Chloroflexaceae bacterium]